MSLSFLLKIVYQSENTLYAALCFKIGIQNNSLKFFVAYLNNYIDQDFLNLREEIFLKGKFSALWKVLFAQVTLI